MPIEYALEIHHAGDKAAAVWATFKSKSPFMGISVGNVVHPEPDWPGVTPGERMRVAAVEHAISDAGDGPKHKMIVYIERVVAGTLLPA
jgi:hypothetical protein